MVRVITRSKGLRLFPFVFFITCYLPHGEIAQCDIFYSRATLNSASQCKFGRDRFGDCKQVPDFIDLIGFESENKSISKKRFYSLDEAISYFRTHLKKRCPQATQPTCIV